MKTIIKSYKLRIYPTRPQETLLAKTFGCCRLVYNTYLGESIDRYETQKIKPTFYENCQALTRLKKSEQFSWLREVNSQSLQAALKNLEDGYKRFFKQQNKFPVFKSKYDRQSFRVPQRVRIEADKLMIPKFLEGIKAVVSREIEGKILFATISKTTTGKYYASITCEVQHQPYEKTGSSVGIDTGIKDLAILSNGQTYKNIRSLKIQLKKVTYEQRQLSKKTKGSQSRQRQKRKLALVHEKVASIRRDYLQKVTTDIIKNHDVISIEDLAVKNLLKNHHLAGAMSDVALGSFYTMLAYKAAWHDRTTIKIDRFYPSSKTCSSCGWKKEDLTLSDRSWICPSCGTTHDRDLNAAKNILRQGLNILSGCGSQSDSKQKRNKASLLSESMTSEALLTALA